MVLQENTKSGPEQNQDQAEPAAMQQESPRVCKICGGPNHYGCGCEAKAAKEGPGPDAVPDEQPESEAPAEPTFNVAKLLGPEINFTKDIRTMSDCFESLCDCFYDINNVLKVIAGDLITIRKLLSKEDEVKNASENKN